MSVETLFYNLAGQLPPQSKGLNNSNPVTIPKSKILLILTQAGFEIDTDPRLDSTRMGLKNAPDKLRLEDFAAHFSKNLLLLEQAFHQNTIIPDWETLSMQFSEIYDRVKDNRAGQNANYIPQLDKVNPEYFGVSICSISGQRCHFGDVDVSFSIQSVSKPFTYMLAQIMNGTETVHKHVGTEPSGRAFNEIVFNEEGKAHNPMINAGAITTTALIRKDEMPPSERFDKYINFLSKMTGGEKLDFSQQVYLSEKASANRNFAICYELMDNHAFPDYISDDQKLTETVEFYFQLCSVEASVRKMAVAAATLANGGVCPITDEIVVSEEIVSNSLKLMLTCGMYDYSGEFAFSVGLPAKSGVSGIVLVVIPGVMGVAIYSPRLDKIGNSERGVQFCKEMISTYAFHMYESILHDVKIDPTNAASRRSDQKVRLFFAAASDNFVAVKQAYMQEADLNSVDYEGRTALHLAAHRGSGRIVAFLLDHGALIDPKDVFGKTPFDYAEDESVQKLFVEARAKKTAAKI